MMGRLDEARAVLVHEARHLWRVAWRTTAFVGGGVAALLALWLLANFAFADTGDRGASWPVAVVASAVYGMFIGVQVGAVAAIVRAVWTMVAGYLVVPLVLVPAAVLLSFWMFSGLLASSAHHVLDELVRAGGEHEWLVGAIGPAARIGPPILVIALPLLAVDVFMILAHPGVLWSLFVLVVGTAFAFLLAAVPTTLASIVLLLGVWVRRARDRAARAHA